MKSIPRIGVTAAGLSIAFSVVASAVYFTFTPVLVFSALFAAAGALAAWASRARRAALVAAVFGLVPLAQLLIEKLFVSEYLVALPAGIALLIAGMAVANYASSTPALRCSERRLP